jgi:hypothetical protein
VVSTQSTTRYGGGIFFFFFFFIFFFGVIKDGFEGYVKKRTRAGV